jgi:hypothetical protein
MPRRQMSLGTGLFWLENVALPLGMLALQALPLGALLQLLAAWAAKDASQTLLPTWALLFLLVEAYYLSRWLTQRGGLKGGVMTFVSVGALFTLLTVWYLRLYAGSGPFWQATWLSELVGDFSQVFSSRLEAAIGIALLIIGLWWRGLRLGQYDIEHEAVARSFKVGFAALVVALLFSGTVDPSARTALIVQLGLTLPIFLFVGLSTLSLARLAEIRRGRRAQGATQADPTRSWLIAMLALSGGLVLVLFGIEQAFSYQTLLGAVSALKPIWDVISALIGWVAVGVGYILYWLLNPFAQQIQALFNRQSPSNQPLANPPKTDPKLVGKGTNTLPTEWLVAARWILIVIGIIILVMVFLRIFRSIAARMRDDEADEEREDLGAAGILGAQLRALLDNLAARFQRKPSGEDENDALPSHSVRALYRKVLRQAAAQGWRRRATETPQEFAQRLRPAVASQPPAVSSSGSPLAHGAAILPGETPGTAAPELEALTRAYEQARYGDYEPPPGEVAALAADVDRLVQRLAPRPSS